MSAGGSFKWVWVWVRLQLPMGYPCYSLMSGGLGFSKWVAVPTLAFVSGIWREDKGHVVTLRYDARTSCKTKGGGGGQGG